jgi:hypothetical protein
VLGGKTNREGIALFKNIPKDDYLIEVQSKLFQKATKVISVFFILHQFSVDSKYLTRTH